MDPAIIASLAPTGTLRAAQNFGNSVLAQRDPATGEPRGVSSELARELARRLGVPVTFVLFEEAGKAAQAAAKGEWDIGFLAIDPVRGETIDYTPAYVLIEGTYVVPPGSPLTTPAAIDAPGHKIVVATGSAYDLFLTRALKHAELVRFEGNANAQAAFLFGSYDAIAGVKQLLDKLVDAHPHLVHVPGRFMSIEQAMCVPKGRAVGLAYLRGFIEEMKASGFVRQKLDETGQKDAGVAPAAG